MKRLGNGIILVENLFDDRDIEIWLLDHGGIMDVVHQVSGIQHLIEHKTFSFSDLNCHHNATTSLQDMVFLFSSSNDNDQLEKVLRLWFQKCEGGIKLAHNCSILDIKRCIQEIHNEYTFRTISYDLHSLFYYVLMNEIAFTFCGNINTFNNVEKIKTIIDNLSFVQPSDIVVFHNRKQIKELSVFFNQFKPIKHKIEKIELNLDRFFGKKIQTDTKYYQLLFSVEVNDLLYFPIFVPNAILIQHSHLQGNYIQFFFENKRHIEDFLFLLSQGMYTEIVSHFPTITVETYIRFLKTNRQSELTQNFTSFFSTHLSKIIHILQHLQQQYKQSRFIVLGPASDFTSLSPIFSGESVKIDDFVIKQNNYIYDHRYQSTNEMLFANRWQAKKPLLCFLPNIQNVNQTLYPKRDTTFEETIRMIVYFFIDETPNMSDISTDVTQSKFFTNQTFDLQLRGMESNIKTRYNFSLFLIKCKKKELSDIHSNLTFFLYQQKDNGNIYYFRQHYIHFHDYSLIILFSNPADKTKWKNSMVNYFSSINFTSYHLIQSEQSNIYDFHELAKKKLVTF